MTRSKTHPNIFNDIMFGLTIALAFVGATNDNFDPSNVFLWMFFSFSIFFRIKTWLDDRSFFKTANTRNWNFRIGMIFAIISWVLWGLSLAKIYDIELSIFYLGLSVFVSTLWIVAAAIRSGAYPAQYIWIATNTIYMVGLWLIVNQKRIFGDSTFIIIVGLMLIILFADWIFGKTDQAFSENAKQ